MSPSGPLGGPRPFVKDNRTVMVLIGINGHEPDNNILRDLERLVTMEVSDDVSQPITVNLTTTSQPTPQQKQEWGVPIKHIQQYDVTVPWKKISQKQINGIHNDVMSVISEFSSNIVGTKTEVI